MTTLREPLRELHQVDDVEWQDLQGRGLRGVSQVINNYFGTVNNVARADNCNFGVNHGVVTSATHLISHDGSSTGKFTLADGKPVSSNAKLPVLGAGQNDLLSLLNPIPDASHTRNRRLSGPDSACFPGTRRAVLDNICAWADNSTLGSNPHMMWIYGYAGCGKSAIAQEICKHFSDKNRLAASFFFSRNAGDRSRTTRFATTVAHQVAIAIPTTASIIERVVKANPGLLSNDMTSLSDQFEYLVYRPINAAKRERLPAFIRQKTYLIVLDGLDECEDRVEIATFIEELISFFSKSPRFPLRFLITSRVENHLHQRLHGSGQVCLLDLVEHTPDSDISAALDAAITKERNSRTFARDKSWPSAEEEAQLVKHIGGSFIFMTTIIRFLFDPEGTDGRTPMERLPLVLSLRPDFDGLYRAILEPWKDHPHFRDVVGTLALAQEPLSIAQISDILHINPPNVIQVLLNLHSIIRVPDDDRTPVTLWHTSLRDFLTAQDRSGALFTPTEYHRRLAYASITSASDPEAAASSYALRFAMVHWGEFIDTVKGDEDACDREMEAFIVHLHSAFSVRPPSYRKPSIIPDAATRIVFEVMIRAGIHESVPTRFDGGVDSNGLFRNGRTPLGTAFEMRNWNLVRELVSSAKANVNVPLRETLVSSIVLIKEEAGSPSVLGTGPTADGSIFECGTPLAFACYRNDVKLVTRMLECGADPNLEGGVYGSAIQTACSYGLHEVVNVLLKHGADPNVPGGLYGSALHACVFWAETACAGALLEHGADVNIRGEYDSGDTPLHSACCKGCTDLVELLLDFWADSTIKDQYGRTALQVAVAEWENDSEIAQLLRGRGIKE
ncbi:hypothetical protein NMY22_g5684 [Coprinellus aureogranulatus]|nr:hypothetical protein NMY22_g5684 [Coprinellus aureogranulatus]